MQYHGNFDVIQRDGRVVVYVIRYTGDLQFDSTFDNLKKEWHGIEEWSNELRAEAPEGVNSFWNTAPSFWWYDTNEVLTYTAVGSTVIAIVAVTVIMLISSRSLEISFLAMLTIGFILISVTAILQANGWSLGL